MEDRKIVELYWQRDPRAIGESSARYSRHCFKVAQNILGNVQDCEECVNDIWLHAWNSILSHRPEVLRLFLARITRRLSFNCFKAGTAQKRGGGQIDAVLDELEECLAGRESVEDELIAKELGESISRFIRALPEREGNAFIWPDTGAYGGAPEPCPEKTEKIFDSGGIF